MENKKGNDKLVGVSPPEEISSEKTKLTTEEIWKREKEIIAETQRRYSESSEKNLQKREFLEKNSGANVYDFETGKKIIDETKDGLDEEFNETSRQEIEALDFEKEVEVLPKKPAFLQRVVDERIRSVGKFNIKSVGSAGDIDAILGLKMREIGPIVGEGGRVYIEEEMQRKLGILNYYLKTGEVPGGGLPLNLDRFVNEFPKKGGVREAVASVIESHFPGFRNKESAVFRLGKKKRVKKFF